MKLPEIIVSSWSFHTALYTGWLRIAGVPRCARALGFGAVELQDMFLWPGENATPLGPSPADRVYAATLLNRIKRQLRRHRVRLHTWDVSPEYGKPRCLTDREGYMRLALNTAADLGARVVRLTIDHDAVGEDTGPVIDALRPLIPVAEGCGLRLALENHSKTAPPEQIMAIVEGVPGLGICLDFGNLRPSHAEADFERMAPYAVHAHAKCYAFSADGEETTIPYKHRIRTLKAVGYSGAISIEFEGDGHPRIPVLAARRLIQKWWAERA